MTYLQGYILACARTLRTYSKFQQSAFTVNIHQLSIILYFMSYSAATSIPVAMTTRERYFGDWFSLDPAVPLAEWAVAGLVVSSDTINYICFMKTL